MVQYFHWIEKSMYLRNFQSDKEGVYIMESRQVCVREGNDANRSCWREWSMSHLHYSLKLMWELEMG